MENKCDKYETLFIFSKDDYFNEHLSNCSECSDEHEKMLKVSSLVKEVKPLYLAKEKRIQAQKLVASFLLFICCVGFIGISINNERHSRLQNAQESVIAKMGLPVDEYGLLTVE